MIKYLNVYNSYFRISIHISADKYFLAIYIYVGAKSRSMTCLTIRFSNRQTSGESASFDEGTESAEVAMSVGLWLLPSELVYLIFRLGRKYL